MSNSIDSISQKKKYVMPLSECKERAERMKRYNEHFDHAGFRHHRTSQKFCEDAIRSWGHDPKPFGIMGYTTKLSTGEE